MNNYFDDWINSGCWRRKTTDGKGYPIGNVFVKDGPINEDELKKNKI